MSSPIELIKKSFPLAPFISPYTSGLKSTGRHFFMGRCPFHKSDNPKKLKFWVDTQHNICGCFVPGCPAYANQKEDPHTKPLDIINFWALYRNIPLEWAVAELARKANLPQ